jgi:hypothetical protein
MNPELLDHDDDPLPPLEVKKISLIENVSIQSVATTVGFFCFLGMRFIDRRSLSLIC